MKVINPDGWSCTLGDAPPGPFVPLDHQGLLCFKSEYHHGDGRVIAYNSAGEFFCGEGDAHMVQPVKMEFEL